MIYYNVVRLRDLGFASTYRVYTLVYSAAKKSVLDFGFFFIFFKVGRVSSNPHRPLMMIYIYKYEIIALRRQCTSINRVLYHFAMCAHIISYTYIQCIELLSLRILLVLFFGST